MTAVRWLGPLASGVPQSSSQVPQRVRGSLLAAGAAESLRETDYPGQFVALVNRDLYRADLGLTWEDPSFRRAEGLVM